MDWILDLFKIQKPAIGMIHVLPLPSSPRYDALGGMERIVNAARQDLQALQDGGIDAVMFCNEHDRPYTLKSNQAVVASMAFVIGALRAQIRIPFGVDILWDPISAIAVAHASGGKFVREIFTGVYASDMGFWDTNVGEALRFRNYIHADNVRVLFNINAEFAAPLAGRPIEDVAKSVVFSSLPDGICVSGPMTGHSVNRDQLEIVRKAAYPVPVFINTGAKKENISDLIQHADGVIVGSSLKVSGNTWNPVDQARVAEFMAQLRKSR
jgi:uncharacterized protein